jgi:WD40 repeat protein
MDCEPISLSYESYEYDYEIEEDSTICILLHRNREPLTRLTIPGKVPLCVAISPQCFGPLIVIGFSDGSLFLAWDLTERYHESCFLSSHQTSVKSLAFHSNQLLLVSGAIDGCIGVHKSPQGFEWVSAFVVVSHLSVTAVSWHDENLILGMSDGTLVYWAQSGEGWSNSYEFSAHVGHVSGLVDIPQIAGHPIISYGQDRSLCFLKTDGQKIQLESKLSNFSSDFSRIVYDPVANALRITCVGGIEYAWRCEEDGKWRQFHEDLSDEV